MSTTADHAHPRWCDARSHANDNPVHTATPLTHRGLVDDVDVSTGVQADPAGNTTVSLALQHLLSVWPDGSPVEAEVALLPCEAELIAYRLLADAKTAREANQ